MDSDGMGACYVMNLASHHLPQYGGRVDRTGVGPWQNPPGQM